MTAMPNPLGLHSFLIMAFGALLVMTLLHVSMTSGLATTESDWGDFLFARASLTSSAPASNRLPLLGHRPSGSSTGLASDRAYHHSKLDFVGKYAKLRGSLDYAYHDYYNISRQALQDSIIDSILNETQIIDRDGSVCSSAERLWIVYTAGAMGAGKSHTIRQLAAKSRFPLHSFVRIDYDAVRQRLPEFQVYMQHSPEQAGEWTRKEAGYIAELATQAALYDRQNVLVDGSLRDAEWFQGYFSYLRRNHPRLRIGILHVTAPQEAVFQRTKDRSRVTGRIVPRETLLISLQQVPKSVQVLAPLSDFFCELHNPPDAEEVEIMTEGLTWDTFKRTWLQTCAPTESVPSNENRIDDA